MPDTAFIYCLKDPASGDVRYIGKTTDPEGRLQAHLTKSSKRRNHLGGWLRSLASRREIPMLILLHEVAKTEHWQQEERRYISCARALGMDLVNATDGGEGSSGYIETPEQLAAKSAARRGVPWSPAQRAVSNAKRGLPLSLAQQAAYAAKSAALKGVPWSPARRVASAAKRGRPQSPEQRAGYAARSAKLKGVPWSRARRAAYERSNVE